MTQQHVCLIESLPGTPARATLAEALRLHEAGLTVTVVAGPRAAKTLATLPDQIRRIFLPIRKGRFRKLRAARDYWRTARDVHADYYHAHSSVRLMTLAAAEAFFRRRTYFGDFNNIIIMATGGSCPARSNAGTFDHEDHWKRQRSETELHRIESTLQIIPEGIRSALDVGCGDGRITNCLAERVPEVIGVDPSSVALNFLDPAVHAIQGTAAALPLADRSVDLVLASEVIEHLPDPDYEEALREFQRTARSHIVISVPFTEQLEAKDLVCPLDGRRFNVNGHLRRFDLDTVRHLFDRFELVRSGPCGAPVRFHYHPLLLWIKQRLAGTWARPPFTICPECGTNLHPTDQRERNAIARWCDETNDRLRARRKLERSHIVLLYRRRD